MPVDLIFSFDSEDYETPASDEGELWWAEALTRHGLTGSFCLVGEEARALRDRGRRDVLAALARHDVAFHTDLHSIHPVHAEYLEGMGWDEGVSAVLAREAAGIADVRELTEQHPSAYCRPGASWAPQVPAAMALLGVPVFCDAPFESEPGVPLWYCGSLCLKYHLSFDRYFGRPDRQASMRADFLALLNQRRANGGALVMYTHPCRLITAEFPSNFTAGANPPRSAWQPAPVRPRAEIAELMADFDDFLGWVARETDARPTTYRALWERYRRASLWLEQSALCELISRIGDAPIPLQIAGHWLSPAEQLGVLARAATWRREHGTPPAEVAVRSLLGPDDLPGPAPEAEVTHTAVLDAAAQADAFASRTGRVPSVVRIGERLLGPAALLRAIAQTLRGAERVRIGGPEELPPLAKRDDVATLHFRGTWSIFPPEFEAPRLIRFAQIQTWSARPMA